MIKLMDIWNWTMVAPWRTWLAHAVLAFGLSALFSPWATATFYLLREIEQAWLKWSETGDFDGRDAVLDVLFPMLAASLYAMLF